MEWDSLFRSVEIKDHLKNKLIDSVDGICEHDETSEMQIVLVSEVLIALCLRIGMNNDDFENLLDLLEEEYPGW